MASSISCHNGITQESKDEEKNSPVIKTQQFNWIFKI